MQIMRRLETTPGLGPKLCVAEEVLKRRMLWILLSDIHNIWLEHTSGIKENCLRSSGHSTSRIWRSTAGQVWSHGHVGQHVTVLDSGTTLGSSTTHQGCSTKFGVVRALRVTPAVTRLAVYCWPQVDVHSPVEVVTTLRVLPAVTRLTVYRRPQVTRRAVT